MPTIKPAAPTVAAQTRPRPQRPARRRSHTYNNGQPYRPARGRSADRDTVEDYTSPIHPIIQGLPTRHAFVDAVQREMRIRKYATNTIIGYVNNLKLFLNWFGQRPHKVTSESVRDFLETIALTDASSAKISSYLTAIRTAFDKMCGRSVTLGLVTPRRPKRLPIVLSDTDTRLILEAAHQLTDKLLISLMYSTGMRVSEVSRLRWTDIDFERNSIRICRAKGQVDRIVMLPNALKPTLQTLTTQFQPTDYLFPGDCKGRHGTNSRHISPRTVQRTVKRIAQLAGIRKHVTPHVFRSALA